MTDTKMSPLSRRGFLGITVAAGATVVLASCAGPAPSNNQGATPSGPPKRGGILRVSAGDGAFADMDPHGTDSGGTVKRNLFDSLFGYDDAGQLQPWLAEKFEPEGDDMKTWIVQVKEGVTFHDGKPLTSDDVEFTIKRIVDGGLAAAALLSDIDLKKTEKVDDLTLRLHLKNPNSQLKQGFSPSYSAIVPVGFDPAKPVGTGPFKHKSFTPNQRWEGVRFDDYWAQKDGAYLDGLQVSAFDTSTAALNALLAGQLDAVPNIMPSQLPQITSRSNLKTVESETGYIMQVNLHTGKGMPFEDNRVREAFKLMLDRQQLVDVIYSGHGKVANDVGVFPQFDPAAADPPVRTRDMEKAKQLLKDAGKENMKVKLRVGQLLPGMTESAELIQQQAKEIGITIEIDKVTDIAQFYSDDYFTAEMQVDYTNTITMYDGCYYWWLSKAGYNNTAYSNPDVDRLFEEAIASPQAEYEKKMQEMTQVLYDDSSWAVWGRQNIIDVHTDKVVGIKEAPGRGYLNNAVFYNVSLA